eukprot:7537284-Pyramimonas_sp.AAC.1
MNAPLVECMRPVFLMWEWGVLLTRAMTGCGGTGSQPTGAVVGVADFGGQRAVHPRRGVCPEDKRAVEVATQLARQWHLRGIEPPKNGGGGSTGT